MEKCPGTESGQAGKMESCNGCPNANICASSKPDQDIPIIRDNLSSIKSIIAVLSGKGGVGKSTVSRNIASSIALQGLSTLILDFDLSGPSIPRMTNTYDEFVYETNTKFKPVRVEKNLYAMSLGYLEKFENEIRVFNTNTKNYAIKKILKLCDFSGIDVMVIDTPPNITDEHLALVNYVKPHSSVVVTTPQKIAFDDVVRQIQFCRKAEISILGLIENMKNFNCPKCFHTNKIYADSKVENFCLNENIKYLGSLELKMEFARESDNGNSISDPIFDRIATKIISDLSI